MFAVARSFVCELLITGHTGFKGAWLAIWLHQLGARVVGISLPPSTSPNLFELAHVGRLVDSRYCDIRDATSVAREIATSNPELVFHLAAQALVRPSYIDPLTTFDTNMLGTARVLDSLRNMTQLRVVVAITTDKVYRNSDAVTVGAFAEDDPLGGHDPYSASKAGAEMVIASYRDSFFSARGVAVASARAGNVIGGGDWAEDRLIPDAMRAWSKGARLEVRRPHSTRPWQHVLEPLLGYLVLAERMWRQPGLAGAYNFGPASSEAASVRKVVELAQSAFGGGEVAWGDGSSGPHEARWLALDVTKARKVLGIDPVWTLEEAVMRSVKWYVAASQGKHARTLCLADIEKFRDDFQRARVP